MQQREYYNTTTQPLPSASTPTSPSSFFRSRSNTALSASTNTLSQSLNRPPPRKRRAVHCDVIPSGMFKGANGKWALPEAVRNYLSTLGEVIELPQNGFGPSAAPSLRPPTPAKSLDLDPAKRLAQLKLNLHELWSTEAKYLLKLKSLVEDFAMPLRRYARKQATSLITAYDLNRLFSNIDELIPISEAFERDLHDLVRQFEQDPRTLPDDFAETIAYHIRQMEPYRIFLAGSSTRSAFLTHLLKTANGFEEFIRSAEVGARESTGATGGFDHFLAELFQRLPRYKLFLELMLNYLDTEDPEAETLQAVVPVITSICSMEIPEDTKKAAIMWTLNHTITEFPADLYRSDLNTQYITSLDVNEVVDSLSAPLRCTLFLFTDRLLLVKRPDKNTTGKELAGVDDINTLLQIHSDASYSQSHGLSTATSNLKRPKKGTLGYRGVFDILELHTVDFGGTEFGLVVKNPPTTLDSERWCGRPERRYEVARQSYPNEFARVMEKENFLKVLNETKCVWKSVTPGSEGRTLQVSRKSREMKEERGGEDDTVTVLWSMWDEAVWETNEFRKRGRMALQVVADPASRQLDFGGASATTPDVIVRAELLDDDQCRLLVRDRKSKPLAPEIIPVHRITAVIAELSSSYGLCTFPKPTPSTPGSRARSGSRPGIFGNVIDAISGSSGNLRRGQSITSKTSTVTSTTNSNVSDYGSFSPLQSGRVATKGSPNWYGQPKPLWSGSKSERGHGGVDDGEELEYLRSSVRPSSTQPPSPSYLEVPGSRSRRRSTSAPPPPQPRFLSPSPPPTTEKPTPRRTDTVFSSPAPTREAYSRRPPSSQPPKPQLVPHDQFSPEPYVPPSQPSRAPAESPMYPGTTRRRVMGPRAMGDRAASPLPSSEPARWEPSVQRAASTQQKPPSPAPFERDHSPTPISPTFSRPPPSRTLRESDSPSPPSMSTSKRPLPETMSPRAPPSKKTASVSAELEPRRPTSYASAPSSSGKPRVPSGGHGRNVSGGKRNRRVVSNTSTIRGDSPPPPTASPTKREPSSLSMMEGVEDSSSGLEDEEMANGDDSHSTPWTQVKDRLDELHSLLSKQVSDNKENHRLVSKGTLPRSPHTRNVYLKSQGNSLASILNSDELPSKLDSEGILRWIESLREQVAKCVGDQAKEETESESGLSQTDFDVLESERELIGQQLEALTSDLAKATASNKDLETKLKEVEGILKRAQKQKVQLEEEKKQLASKLGEAQDQTTALLNSYHALRDELPQIYEGFDQELQDLGKTLAVTPSSRERALAQHLQTALTEKAKLVVDHTLLTREHELALEEKKRWETILRQHGLLPS